MCVDAEGITDGGTTANRVNFHHVEIHCGTTPCPQKMTCVVRTH